MVFCSFYLRINAGASIPRRVEAGRPRAAPHLETVTDDGYASPEACPTAAGGQAPVWILMTGAGELAHPIAPCGKIKNS
jgi:hypothetical protein